MNQHKHTPTPTDSNGVNLFQCGCGRYFYDDGDISIEMRQRMLGRAVKLVRLYWGWTQPRLAEELDMSIQRVRFIENGKANLTIATVRKLEVGLGLTNLALYLIAFEGLPFWRCMIEPSMKTVTVERCEHEQQEAS